MDKLYVDTPPALHDLCARLRHSPWLAVDTEFMREKTYFPRLCLLQVADRETAACVDPLALEDLSPLKDLLYAPQTVKVFHAARQDLEIFLNLWERLPAPVFDTQAAAMLAGLGEQIGYADLVKRLLGVDLEKGHTRADWSHRPLEPEQIDYAYDDVIHLGEAYLVLRDRLEKAGRLAWLEEDFAGLTDPAAYNLEPEGAWQRIRGRQRLRGAQLAALQRLAAWRERRARERDLPRRWVLKDEVMVDLARRLPARKDGLQKIRGLERGTVERHGQEILEEIAAARDLPPERWPSERSAPRPSAAQDALADMLSAALRVLAEDREISPGAVAARADLERLAMGERDIPLLRGWRGALAGERLLALAEGRAALRVVDGRPRVVE
jgi:ribonuclease D